MAATPAFAIEAWSRPAASVKLDRGAADINGAGPPLALPRVTNKSFGAGAAANVGTGSVIVTSNGNGGIRIVVDKTETDETVDRN